MHVPHSLRFVVPSIAAALLLAGCGGSSSPSSITTPPPSGSASGPSNSWTWAAGSNVAGAWGSYGALGTGTATTAPGARNAPLTWSDSTGALWLFGGLGYDTAGAGGELNDLWKFSTSTSTWTWMGGASVVNDVGVYGAQGVSASTNHPGARAASAGWTDAAGTFWLFGGNGFNASTTKGMLADLWQYSPASGQWTWVAGSSELNVSGVYGARGIPDATSSPGARDAASTWRDSAGNLWLFGGTGYDATGATGSMSDLWSFNVATRQWTWVSGPGTADLAGQYGVLGIALSTNAPGARFGAVSWIDSAGNLWLFGGQGYDGSGVNGSLNDLWEFTPSTGIWTWAGGFSTAGAPGLYGTMGTAASGNVPGARGASTAWTDSSGDFWLFGGLGVDSAGLNGYLDDLWVYKPSTGQWTFMAGSTLANVSGVYGTILHGAAGNAPGSRFSASGWIDSSNALWLIGGQGHDAAGAVSSLNDLWKYTR